MPASAPPSGRGGKGWLVLTSVLSGLLLVAGGVLTYLWIDTSGQLDETQSEVVSLEGDVSDRDSQISGLQSQLEDAREQIEGLQTDLEGSEGQREHLEDANEAIGRCLDLIDEWLFTIVVLEDPDAANDLFNNEVEPACDEADQYR